MDVPLLITKINTVQINVLSRTKTFKSSFQVARELSKLLFVNLEDIHQYLWNSLPRVCAIDLPTLVLPTPGGPTKQRIGPANHTEESDNDSCTVSYLYPAFGDRNKVSPTAYCDCLID